jgi:hypothetical protein
LVDLGIDVISVRQMSATRRSPEEHGSWGIYSVGSRYQATTAEDTACCSEL